MWILQWLPDWIFYLILLLGLVGFLATYLLKFIPIPALYVYRTPIQIVSLILTVYGTFMIGAIHDNEAWQRKVNELEKKVVQAQLESKDANEKLNESFRDKKEKIVKREVVVKQYIDREVVKYDTTCVIPKEFINAVNQSAEDARK